MNTKIKQSLRSDELKQSFSANNDIIMQNRIFAYLALVTGGILSIPLIAMLFTTEVQWGAEDFIIMGIILFGMGSLFVSIARVILRNYRLLVGIRILFLTLYIWAELAVGIFTNLGS